MALLKAELSYARMRRRGVRLLERVVSRFDLIGRMGSLAPGVANFALANGTVRLAIEKTVGLAAKRPLPQYAREPFSRWFAAHAKNTAAPRGPVYLWNDCSVQYYEPEIGRAAVEVLEAAGYEVRLPRDTGCCGRPAFSVGRLDLARRFGQRNLATLAAEREAIPVIFLEPSCYSMFKGDYAELSIEGARAVAGRCVMFEQFIFDLLQKEPGAIPFAGKNIAVAIHGHCHAKAITDVNLMPKLARAVPGASASMIESGCCGMAGSFGALRTKYELSLEVAAPLVERINALDANTAVVASGTSCRQQLNHLTNCAPMHMAQFLAGCLKFHGRKTAGSLRR
jgi:Fe-S oxidoreductase